MKDLNSKLFRDDPAAYYTELGAQRERERIIELLKSSLLMAVDEKANLVVGRELMHLDRTSAALVIKSLIWAIENRGEQK